MAFLFKEKGAAELGVVRARITRFKGAAQPRVACCMHAACSRACALTLACLLPTHFHAALHACCPALRLCTPWLLSEAVAPYRRPSMLQWLRKSPRLLLFSGATLAASVSQTLGLLAPQLMLPDEAASVLDKCPQLLGRNAAATQVRAA